MGASKKKANHFKTSKKTSKKKDTREVLSFEELPLDEYEKKDKNKDKKKIKIKLDKKKIIMALAILLILVLSVIVFFNRDTLLNCRGKDPEAHNFTANISGTSVDNGNFRTFAQGLCYASDVDFVYLNSEGDEQYSRQHSMANPVLKTRGDYAIVYDLGADRFSIYNDEGHKFSAKTQEKIFLADIDSSGNYILVTKAKDYNAKLYAFNSENNAKYTYSFADYQITAAAMNNSGDGAVLCGVSADKGSKISAVYVISFSSKEPVAKREISDDLLYDCEFLTDNSVCAIGQEGAYVCSGNRFGKLSKVSYDGKSLTAYDMNTSTGTLVLSLSRSGDGHNCNISFVNSTGSIRTVVETSYGITSVSSYKDRVAFSDKNNVYLYNSNGNSVASCSISSVKQVKLFTTNGLYLLGHNGITGVAL